MFESIIDYIMAMVQFWKQTKPLSHRSKVHKLWQEPGILTGYRPTHQPWRYYLLSLFQIHNETLNVWTHLIGFFVIWCTLINYSQVYSFWTDKNSWSILVFGVCCLITHLVSVVAHLLHSKSIYIHYMVLMLDYIGVTLFAFGTGILAFYSCSDRETYAYFGNYYLLLLTIFTYLNYILLCFAKFFFGNGENSLKKGFVQLVCIFAEALLLCLPFAARYYKCYQDELCSLSSLNHISLTLAFFVLQGFFYASHIPEIFFPGKFDITCQSHQIFHVVATIAQILEMRAVHQDIQNGFADHAEPNFLGLFVTLTALIAADILSLLYMRRLIPNNTDKKKFK